MLDLRQELKQKQGLSAWQIQQIKLLEIPAVELEARIRKELEDNPALMEATSSDDDRGDSAEKVLDDETFETSDTVEESLNDYREEDDIPYYKLQQLSQQEARRDEIPFASKGMSVIDYLEEQIEMMTLTEKEQLIATYIVGNLREDGYLDRTATEISNDILFKESIDVSSDSVEEIIRKIQTLDPPGVAASSLQECLLIQLNRLSNSDLSKTVAENVLKYQYDAFINKRYEQIYQKGISPEELQGAIELIVTLNPKPGNGFDNSDQTLLQQVSPDFIVTLVEDRLQLYLTDEREIPSLRVEPTYEEMASSLGNNHRTSTTLLNEEKEARRFAKEKVDSAGRFITALQQRFHTLRATMNVIMQLQEDFFRTGDTADLKPMILKDVAQRTGFDISTISRVSNSKYVQSDHGIYPLKFFFSEASLKQDGSEVSSHEVKRILKEAIEGEDKKNPLTDMELSEILQKQGFVLARRTVAKYREQLQIPTARMRRVL